MKISVNWLKEYIDINLATEALGDALTAGGLEVEGLETIESIKGGLEGVVIGEVLTCEKHPDADKLSKTTVDLGNDNIVPIVCGAPNVAAGQKVVVATVGTMLYPDGGEGFKIKKAKIRGEVSMGMICAEDELGLGTSHDGIIVLDTDKPNGTPAAEYFEIKNEEVFEIGLTPNRADAASHVGTARDIVALTGEKLRMPSVEDFKVDNHDLPIAVTVEDTTACPRYSGLTISGLEVKESPEWLQNRLKSIGLAPINNVVDVTNFVLHELGQPLHAFDADQITGNQVIVKQLPEGTAFTTLDGESRKLSDKDLMICNAEEGMCIAGVFGGEKSGVTEGTTKIFLESAYFSADSIRRSSQRHTLKTDASFRFERGTDPNITVYALKRAALLIQEVAGGQISSEITDIYPTAVEDFVIPVTYTYINKLIGIEIPKARINQILTDLDITLQDISEEGFTAIVPPYRVDVTRPADIVEEVLRIYGLDNIPLEEASGTDYLADFPANYPQNNERKVAEILTANGYYEIMTNSITNSNYKAEVKEEEQVKILNFLSEDLDVMRQQMVFNFLEVISHNHNRRQRDLKLYEFGNVYFKEENGYRQNSRLAMAITGNFEAENWINPSRPVTFHDLSAQLSKIFEVFKISKLKTEKISNEIFAYGLQIGTRKQQLGYVGLVQPELAKQFGLKEEIFFADLDWDAIMALVNNDIVFEAVSKFPEVRRDLSLVIDKSIDFAQIMEVAQKSSNNLITNINCFDVYEGDKIDAGKKAYALSFILQDKNKTLNDKVIDKTMNKLQSSFEKQLGAVIRQ
ncbi:phenylalanine--tRNA ligase subunit beta [Persicobacter diffluens]|uniref:Phenylalanine--tRNA ligase beta subunit n=1 Tax=Persicobacter diffluens TaxID=981 RepID=A0AAN4VXQ5_9BACT|nr:phenylalanine--tRNA ligase beta subunit [Persicobacter diffluens]